VLSNPDRRKKYDLYGTVGEDDEEDDIFSGMFGDIFGSMGGGFGKSDDFDSFMDFLEKDDLNSFKSMFQGKKFKANRLPVDTAF